MCRGKEREDEDVAVPENVSPVPRTGEAARTDCSLSRLTHRAHQMEERDADGMMKFRITFDQHVRLVPSSSPHTAMFAEETLEPGMLGGGERRGGRGGIHVVCGHTLEDLAVPTVEEGCADRASDAPPASTWKELARSARPKDGRRGARKRREANALDRTVLAEGPCPQVEPTATRREVLCIRELRPDRPVCELRRRAYTLVHACEDDRGICRAVPQGGDAPCSEPAVAKCQKRFVDALEGVVEPVDRQAPRRVVVDVGDVPA